MKEDMWKNYCESKRNEKKNFPKTLVMAFLCAFYLHIHLLMYVFTYNSEQGSNNTKRKTLMQQHEMDVTEHVIRSTKRIAVPFRIVVKKN